MGLSQARETFPETSQAPVLSEVSRTKARVCGESSGVTLQALLKLGSMAERPA